MCSITIILISAQVVKCVIVNVWRWMKSGRVTFSQSAEQNMCYQGHLGTDTLSFCCVMSKRVAVIII